jgi:hypothetical protein
MGIVKKFKVSPCSRKEIKDFIETWHYSKSINGVISDYCFKLEDSSDNLIGGMIYGRLAMASCWKKYGNEEADVSELRRLCCIDNTPKNTESYFIGNTLRWLAKNTTIKTIVSYADRNFGHEGIIYKASNFTHVGDTSKGRVIVYEGKRYHDKCIRTKHKGELKPFSIKIKEALDSGEAYYIKTLPKYIYCYNLKR